MIHLQSLQNWRRRYNPNVQ